MGTDFFLGGGAGREVWDTPSNTPEERQPQVLYSCCSTSEAQVLKTLRSSFYRN